MEAWAVAMEAWVVVELYNHISCDTKVPQTRKGRQTLSWV